MLVDTAETDSICVKHFLVTILRLWLDKCFTSTSASESSEKSCTSVSSLMVLIRSIAMLVVNVRATKIHGTSIVKKLSMCFSNGNDSIAFSALLPYYYEELHNLNK